MKGLDVSSFFSLSLDTINNLEKLGNLRFSLIKLIYEIALAQAT